MQARVQQVDAVDAFGGVAQQAVAVARADQLREQVEVATEVEHVRIRREHDVGQVRFRLRRFAGDVGNAPRSEEHTSELQSLMRTSYAVFCLKKKKQNINKTNQNMRNHYKRCKF